MLASAASDEGVSLNLRAANPNDGGDSVELNFALLDPSAVGGDHLVRFGTRTNDVDTGEQITPLGTSAAAPQVVNFRLEYAAVSQTISGYYDLGSGPVGFTPTTDVSTWNMGPGDEFQFALGANVLKFSGGTPTGNFSIDRSKTHFGAAALSIPEPSLGVLLLLGVAALVLRRRPLDPF